MKIRSGFVSNSSSSSFVAVVPMKIHEKVLEKNHPYVRAVVEALGSKRTVFGIECFVTSTYSDQGYGTWDCVDADWPCDDIPNTRYGNEMEPYFAYEELYMEEAEKEGEIFTHSESH